MATSPRRMRSVTNFSPPLIVSSVCIRHSTNQEQSRKAALNDMYLHRVQRVHQLAQSSRLLMPFWPTAKLPLSCVKQPDSPPFVKLQAPTIGLLPETISFRSESIIVLARWRWWFRWRRRQQRRRRGGGEAEEMAEEAVM